MKQARPSLEVLEDRTLLANFYWFGPVSGTTGVFGDKENWSTNPGVRTPPAAAPTPNDSLYYQNTAVSCVLDSNVLAKELYMQESFTGSIVLDHHTLKVESPWALQGGISHLHGGDIVFEYDDDVFVVNGGFSSWQSTRFFSDNGKGVVQVTGGAQFYVTGAASNILDVRLVLGNDYRTWPTSTMHVLSQENTVIALNEFGDIDIEFTGYLRVGDNALNQETYVNIEKDASNPAVLTNRGMITKTGIGSFTTQLPIEIVDYDARLQIEKGLMVVDDPNNTWSVKQWDGKTQIWVGAEFTVEEEFVLYDGSLQFMHVYQGDGIWSGGTVTTNGNFNIHGDVIFGTDQMHPIPKGIHWDLTGDSAVWFNDTSHLFMHIHGTDGSAVDTLFSEGEVELNGAIHVWELDEYDPLESVQIIGAADLYGEADVYYDGWGTNFNLEDRFEISIVAGVGGNWVELTRLEEDDGGWGH